MKSFITFISITGSIICSAQPVSLNECIESGLANKSTIQLAKTESVIAGLKILETKAKFLPQLKLAYEYVINPIIASQFVPIGQFNPDATEEKIAIQFGTRWQQTAGFSVYQPLIDKSIKSRLAENKLSETLTGIELKKAENDLIFEIIKSYSKIIINQNNLEENGNDTVRSFLSYSLIKARWEEGKTLKTELNDARINHLTNVSNYQKAVAKLIDEKIYLHFLTNISLERILADKLNPLPSALYNFSAKNSSIISDSLPEFQTLLFREKLILQQIKTERTKYFPTIGFQGFLGANQFSNTFDPALKNSWFGNSFAGLAVRLPLFSPDQSINANKQLIKQLEKIKYQKDEFQLEKNKDLYKVLNSIDQFKSELTNLQNILLLKKENMKSYQYRLQTGQLSGNDLNIQENDLQKISSQVQQIQEKLNLAILEELHIRGLLNIRYLNSFVK